MGKQMISRVSLALLSMQRYSWEQGVSAQAFLELGETETAVLLARDAVQRQNAEGRLACMHEREGVTDPGANGEAVLVAAELKKDPRLQAGLEAMLKYYKETAPRAADRTIYHVPFVNEVWIDSMYMAPPFLVVAGQVEDGLVQIAGVKKRLWNPGAKLYAHIWNDERGAFTREAHWGVGNGWAAAGITRVIRSLPEAFAAERSALQVHVREIIDGCLAYQRADGLFHDVVDQPETFVETNLAQMLAYAIYRGVTGGWLPKDYKKLANRLRKAVHKKVDASGFVQGVCGAPNFDRSGTAPEGQAFFLLMEAARQDSK